MMYCLGNLQSFVCESPALRERAQLGMAPGEPGTGKHGRQVHLPEALMVPCALEQRHRLPERVHRPTIVALGVVGDTEELVRQRVEDAITARHGEGEGALAGVDGLVMRAQEGERA